MDCAERYRRDSGMTSNANVGISPERLGEKRHDVLMSPNEPQIFEFDRSQSTSFKKQARISKMLMQESSSSDDDDDDYDYFDEIDCHSDNNLSQQFSIGPSVPDGRMSGMYHQFHLVSSSAPVDKLGEEMVSLKVLSEIVTPETLMRVKDQLSSVKDKARRSFQLDVNPELKRSEKTIKSKSVKLKAKRRVRECIANLPDGEDINSLYLTLVRRRLHREVEALFSLAKETNIGQFYEFDKDFIDDESKSALIIAVDIRDESMMRKLLGFGVDVGLTIFHAIEVDFFEGLKLILAYDPCTNLRIETDNNHFQIGMTPILFAAHSNNYRMLSLLYQYGHRLTELKEWMDGIEVAWESSNERKMICLARAQPAYITLKSEVNRMNPMKYCLREMKLMTRCASNEQEFSAFYQEVREKYEDYMCSLLDLICSSDELSDLFQLRSRPQDDQSQHIVKFYENTKGNRWELLHCFELLEQAHEENLVRFVTHQQSQLALTYLRYRSLPLLKMKVVAHAMGIMFPILSLFYLCSPNSALGGIITLPVVSFYCHMMSDLAFAAIVLLQVVVREVDNERLGQPLSTLEWIVFIWLLGKWVQEFQECIARGLKSYLHDKWNYTDLLMLSLFSGNAIIRIFDSFYNANSTHADRYEWGPYEPRLIGEGMQAVGYIFLFLRLLGLMRSNRYLGPLQISLAKMMGDIVRFLCLFALVLGAFAFGLTDLYWYYGTKQGSKIFCSSNSSNNTASNRTRICAGQNVSFMTIGRSMANLFWALFGIFDRTELSLQGKHALTEYVGKALAAVYHVVAIIVMLNMLIAMMSKSYEDTSANEETAWKFHRTSAWIRFIRREVVRPPPMNLIPNPWRIKECIRSLKNLAGRCRSSDQRRSELTRTRGSGRSRDEAVSSSCMCCKISRELQRSTVTDGDDGVSRIDMLPPSSSTGRVNPALLSTINTVLRENIRETQSKVVLKKLVRRYKLKYLTKK